MATTEVGFSTSNGTNGTGTIAYPSGIQAGDKIVLVISKNVTADTIATPTNYEILSARLLVGSTLNVAWFWKNAVGTETGNLSINVGGNGKWAAAMGVIRGANDPVVATTTAGDNTTDTTTDYPGFTPGAADSYAMAIGGIQSPTTPNTHTAATGWTTKAIDYSASTDPNVGAIIAGRQLSGSGAVSAGSGSNTIAVRDALYAVTFAPATGGGNVTPTANAGTDQTGIEPFSLVTLNFAGSSDPDGTIASYNVTQTAGPTITLNPGGASRTFTAPATVNGTTLTFSLTVTDNDGATSAADTVNITVNSWDLWVRQGGTWVPRREHKYRLTNAWHE